MLFKSMIIFGSSLLLLNSSLHAESLSPSGEGKLATSSVDLRTAVRKTFEYNPALRTFNYELKAQRGRELQAGLSASPEVSLQLEEGFGTGEFSGTDNAKLTLGVAWVLEGDLRQSHIDVARAGTASLSTEDKIKHLDAAAETAQLYMNSLANQARLDAAIKTVSLAKATVREVKKRVASGRAPKAELARAQADLAYSKLTEEDVEHELDSSIRVLAAQWGETQPSFSTVRGDVFRLPILLPFAELKSLFNNSPEYIRLVSNKRLREAELKLAKSKGQAAWKVNLGVRHIETTNDQALVAGISLPFGERSRNTGGIIEAQENLLQTQAQAEGVRIRFETTLYVLFQELQHSQHQVESYRNEIIPKLELALTETRRAYQLGRYSYLEWRSVQADLLEARRVLVEASITVHLKIIEIERLTGVSAVQPEGKS